MLIMTTTIPFFTIPITHIIMWCAIFCSIASIALLTQNVYATTVLLCATMLILAMQQPSKRKYVALYLFMACCIMLRIYQKQQSYCSHQDFLGKPTIVVGTIQNIQHSYLEKATTTITLQTSKLYSKEIGVLKQPQTVLLQMPQYRAKFLKIGQKISFYKVMLQQPDLSATYATYLIKENIWATAYITVERFYVHKKYQPPWYQHVKQQLTVYFKNSTKYLFNPLFLGSKIHDEQSQLMQHQSLCWGIAYHMARSGIHLVTVLGCMIAVCHYVRIRSRLRFLLYLFLALGYSLITVSSLSFARSLTMIFLQMFSKLNGYQYSSVHAISLTCLATLLYNPYTILFLDFQLSFGVTAIIIWFFQTKWSKTIALLPPLFAV